MIKKFINAFIRLRKKIDSLLLQDNEVIDCKNVYFDRGKVLKRPGYEEVGTNLPLNGRVSLLTEYSKLRTDDRQFLACTEKDVYKLDDTDEWVYLTPSYQTGTVNVSGTAVNVSVGVWDTDWPEEQYYIKFGTDDINGAGSPDIWYLIDEFDSNSTLILTASGETQTAFDYVIKKSFSLDDSEDWDVCYVIEPPGGSDEIWGIFTDGSALWKYDGSGQLENLSGTSLASKYLKSYYDHIMLGNVIDGDSILPQSVYWNNRGEPEQWDTGSYGYEDLIQGKGAITGWEILHERLYVFKEFSITEGYFTGETSPAFTFQQDKIFKGGCPNGKTIINTSSELIFLGTDNVFSFNGFQIDEIGDDVAMDLIENINDEYAHKNFACHISDYYWYCLFIVTTASEEPDRVYVFDYRVRTWTMWAFADFMRCHGEFIRSEGETWDDVSDDITWDDMEGTWGSRTLTSQSNIHAFGDVNGYVYKMDFLVADDNGEDINCFIETKDYESVDENGVQIDKAVKLIKTILSFDSQSGDIQIRYSIDKGVTWSTPVAFTQSTAAREYVQNWVAYGNQVRFRIENIDNSDFELLNMVIGYVNAGDI